MTWAVLSVKPASVRLQTGPEQAPASEILTPGPSAARMPHNAEEFDVYFKKVSNWGRWGAGDELGTLNLITDAKRKQAALGGTGFPVNAQATF